MNQLLIQYSDRKSTRLNSSHVEISYAVFCLKKKERSLTSPLPGALDPNPPARGCPQPPGQQPRPVPVAGGAGQAGASAGSDVFFFFKKAGPPEISPLSPPPTPSQ